MSDRREFSVSGKWVGIGILLAIFAPLSVCALQQRTGIDPKVVLLSILPGLALMSVSKKAMVDRMAKEAQIYGGFLKRLYASKPGVTFPFEKAVLHAHWDRNRIVLFYWVGIVPARIDHPAVYIFHQSTNGSEMPTRALEILDWLDVPCELDSYGERMAQPEVKARLLTLGSTQSPKDLDRPPSSPELQIPAHGQSEPE